MKSITLRQLEAKAYLSINGVLQENLLAQKDFINFVFIDVLISIEVNKQSKSLHNMQFKFLVINTA